MLDGLSQIKFVRWCKLLGLPSESYEVQYPHPYLLLWYECKRRSVLSGVMDYPEPEKGYLDQDAELMLAFEILEELQDTRRQEEEKRSEIKKQAAHIFQ